MIGIGISPMTMRPQQPQQTEKATPQEPKAPEAVVTATEKRSCLKRLLSWLKCIVRTNDLQQNGI